jgi:AcrR family transcriptional regulator
MGRWQPDPRGRLLKAAFELMTERGYEGTTVAEIAERAGLTERTFFRHFSDKREVLFAGSEELESRFLRGLEDAPASASAMDAVARSVEAGSAMIEHREFSRRRQALILANPELMERERIKLARLAAAVADTLRERGVEPVAASLAAEMGVTVFRVAFERWLEQTDERSLPAVVRETFAAMRATIG